MFSIRKFNIRVMTPALRGTTRESMATYLSENVLDTCFEGMWHIKEIIDFKMGIAECNSMDGTATRPVEIHAKCLMYKGMKGIFEIESRNAQNKTIYSGKIVPFDLNAILISSNDMDLSTLKYVPIDVSLNPVMTPFCSIRDATIGCSIYVPDHDDIRYITIKDPETDVSSDTTIQLLLNMFALLPKVNFDTKTYEFIEKLYYGTAAPLNETAPLTIDQLITFSGKNLVYSKMTTHLHPALKPSSGFAAKSYPLRSFSKQEAIVCLLSDHYFHIIFMRKACEVYAGKLDDYELLWAILSKKKVAKIRQ